MLLDLSHPIEAGMRVHPGLPAPEVGATLDHEASRERYQGFAAFHLGAYRLSGGTGTYLDAPFHRHRGGADLAALPLDRLVKLPGLVLDHEGGGRSFVARVDPDEIAGAAVLLRTGWGARWSTEAYWERGPFLAGPLLDLLVERGAALVGIDIWNVDDVEDLSRPAHTRLLAEGIPIVENLADLSGLPRSGFAFTAVPPMVVGGSNFPVRAFAEV
jgi:kynurenine formamidase